jgi:DNA-binding NarL/FixJ family response regulator
MDSLPPQHLTVMTRIAIVEDNESMRQTLVKLIAGAPGCKSVGACASAEEALEKLPAARPDVVLMDIHLPGQTGIACTAQLTAALPQLQVIMLTVYKDLQLIFQALKAGACGYLLKRSSREEILAAIAEVRGGGAPMTSEIARLVVRSFKAPTGAPVSETENLSAREFEILGLLAKGLSNKEIGSQLNISAATVSRHLIHIYTKLHVRCRTEAAAVFLAENRHLASPAAA